MTEKTPSRSGESSPLSGEKAQIGAGTIIILIAVLIVAATTAGVLFNVTDTLRAQAGESGETAGDEVESPLRVAAVTGRVNQTADPHVLNRTRVVVALDGQTPIDLDESTVHLETSASIDTLVYSPDGPKKGVSYGVEAIVDPDNSVPTLANSADRFAITVETPPLAAGDHVLIRVSAESGATETIRIRVPARIDSESAVTLQ